MTDQSDLIFVNKGGSLQVVVCNIDELPYMILKL